MLFIIKAEKGRVKEPDDATRQLFLVLSNAAHRAVGEMLYRALTADPPDAVGHGITDNLTRL